MADILANSFGDADVSQHMPHKKKMFSGSKYPAQGGSHTTKHSVLEPNIPR
jgi:hypothetical protein